MGYSPQGHKELDTTEVITGISKGSRVQSCPCRVSTSLSKLEEEHHWASTNRLSHSGSWTNYKKVLERCLGSAMDSSKGVNRI